MDITTLVIRFHVENVEDYGRRGVFTLHLTTSPNGEKWTREVSSWYVYNDGTVEAPVSTPRVSAWGANPYAGVCVLANGVLFVGPKGDMDCVYAFPDGMKREIKSLCSRFDADLFLAFY